mmetsp:Transcript_8423/g.10419  ORF Transcript_8423/g.10419 Transcript_8423/m.10419 type:complete len:231 (-) Transcript_8423:71-763(-)
MESNAALAGIVQANLLTSHLLFIGFSLNDDAFHQIMDSVLKAQGKSSSCVGTCIQLLHNPYTCELWNPLIQCVSMREAAPDGKAAKQLKKEAQRLIEILLDLLLLRHTVQGSGHILDIRFEHILSEDEKILKQSVTKLTQTLEATFGSEYQIRWPIIRNTLSNYGLRRIVTQRIRPTEQSKNEQISQPKESKESVERTESKATRNFVICACVVLGAVVLPKLFKNTPPNA